MIQLQAPVTCSLSGVPIHQAHQGKQAGLEWSDTLLSNDGVLNKEH
jgi:hypothetical protein